MTGRKVPDFPTFTTSAGYTVQVRRVSPDTGARLRAAAMKELADSRPPVPTERTVIGVDPRTQAPMEQDIPNPKDAAYLKIFEAWEQQVRRLAGLKSQQLMADYAIISEVDTDAVAELRAMHEALGDPIEGETDRQVWLWRIVAPTSEDQIGLLAFMFGKSQPSPEAIEAQKATFPSNPPAA